MQRTSLAALLGVLIGTPAASQSVGSGPLALTLPSSARITALGDIGVAGRDDDVVFYNPAQLHVARGTSFSLTRMSESSRGGTLSTVLRLGSGGVGLGVNYLEYQSAFMYPLGRRDVLDQNLGRGTSALGVLGYSRTYKGYRVGAAAKYAMDVVQLERFSNVYGDLGIARDFGRYNTGLTVQHIGTSFSRGSQDIAAPMVATLGAATSRIVGPLDLVATAGISTSREDRFGGGGGIELGWSWISGYSIALRGGAHSARQGGETELMGGFGFTADRVTLDVAVERVVGNRAAYRAGFRIR